MGLGYITGLCELSPWSETAPGLGIITGPQQMVEAEDGEAFSCGTCDLPASVQSRTWEGPRWAPGEAALNQALRDTRVAVVGHGLVPGASPASFRLLPGPGVLLLGPSL